MPNPTRKPIVHRGGRGNMKICPPPSITTTRDAVKGVAVVYYAKHLHHVKIGTSRDLFERMERLGIPMRNVLAVELGSHGLETMRHREFAHLLEPSLGREHFRLGPSLVQHIERLRESGTGIAS